MFYEEWNKNDKNLPILKLFASSIFKFCSHYAIGFNWKTLNCSNFSQPLSLYVNLMVYSWERLSTLQLQWETLLSILLFLQHMAGATHFLAYVPSLFSPIGIYRGFPRSYIQNLKRCVYVRVVKRTEKPPKLFQFTVICEYYLHLFHQKLFSDI